MSIIIIAALAISVLLVLILAFTITPYEIEEDKRLQDILDMLPNTNCKACGKLSCKGMAEAILQESISLSMCKPGNQKMREDILDYLLNNPNEAGVFVKVKM